MADDERAQRDDLDAALSAHVRAARPAPAELSAGAPSDDEILRYVDGAMDEPERAAFEERLAEQPEAVDRIAVVASALQATGFASSAAPREAPGTRALKAASRFVFQLSQGALTFLRGTTLPLALEPAPAVRSRAASAPPRFFEVVTHYPFETGEIEARLSVEAATADASHSDAIDLQLQVTRPGAALEGIRVKLLRDGRPIDSTPTEHGRCTFTGLQPARYELEIRKGGTEVGRLILDVRGDL
jgi:hypothetical protein